MPCCLVALGFLIPRVTLFFMWVFGYSQRAFEGWFWPLLGFFFMPFTTCAYAIGMVEKGAIEGWALVLLVIAVVLDVSQHGGSAAASHKRR